MCYDILGNTLTKGGTVSYGWDVLNRMTSATFGSDSYTYKYRADGMRVLKVKGFNLTSYMYDGQMPVEELNTLGSTPPPTFIKQVRHGLGARGIDWIEKTQQNNTVITGYPVYDGHGNMIACLFKSGGSYSINDQRSYDAWGNIRAGNTTGDPKARYVANLGHLADDESGLTYMRARYYEPSSGRFVSEDPARDRENWYAYVSNCPTQFSDANGEFLGLSYIITVSFLQNGIRAWKEGTPAAYFACWVENGVLKIGIDYIEKRVAVIGYDLLVKELSAIAASSGAASVQIQGWIASPGGQAFFNRMHEAAARNGWPVEMSRNNRFTQLYWMFEAMN